MKHVIKITEANAFELELVRDDNPPPTPAEQRLIDAEIEIAMERIQLRVCDSELMAVLLDSPFEKGLREVTP